MKTKHLKQNGFTLTEMAIVIVLGGILLAAGLMVGRGQIGMAQGQDVIQIAADLQAASLSFKNRYGYLPGDWIYVANQLPNVAASPGDGLGTITGTMTAAGLAQAGSEVQEAALHLYAAGLIGKIGTNAQMRIQSQYGPVHMAIANAANTSAAYIAANPGVRNVIVFFNLPCEVVQDLDRTLDDSVVNTGRVMTIAACPGGGTAARTFVPL
ncbi:MAG: prepilin-type N-terminal cleavage/methylation protein [Proteobacteria bacterium]|nr:prepilin-type N-terminal cleavage/methylation protein [Pseudomonadota bacterium]